MTVLFLKCMILFLCPTPHPVAGWGRILKKTTKNAEVLSYRLAQYFWSFQKHPQY